MCLQPAGVFSYTGCLADWQVKPSCTFFYNLFLIKKRSKLGFFVIIVIAIITTRYPIHIGLNEGIISPMEPHGLPTDVETLADILLTAGYSTHAVGRGF